MDFLSFSEMVLGLQLGNRCDYSVPIFPEAFLGVNVDGVPKCESVVHLGEWVVRGVKLPSCLG